jgi:peptide/nickel transport system substrate-binding protein
MLLYEDYDANQTVPWMAESLTSSDASTWQLTLRDGVTFSDGTVFDAAAVKYNWERMQGLEGSPGAVAKQIASLTVSSPTVLDIELAQPNSGFDRVVARNLAFIGSPTAMQSDLEGFLQKPIGAGPFLVKSFASGAASYVRNPDYWDAPRPYLDALEIRFVADDQQRLNTYMSGDGDMISIGGALSSIGDGVDDSYLLEGVAPIGGRMAMFNTTRPPFDSKTARLAFAYAIDRQAIADTLYEGAIEVPTHLVSEPNPAYEPSASYPMNDPVEAQRLFDQYAEETGAPMKIAFTAAASAADVAELLQSQLAAYDNVEVTINIVDNSQYLQSLATKNFDIAQFPIVAAWPLEAFTNFYGSTGNRNFGGYSNPQVDQLLADAAATTDEAEQISLFRDVQKIVVTEDAVAFDLFRLPYFTFVRNDVKDLGYAVDGVFLWDRAWIEQ